MGSDARDSGEDRFAQIRSIFLAVCELGEAEREEYLARVTAGDPDLLQDVRNLLARDGSSNSEIRAGLAQEVRNVAVAEADAAVEKIGPHRALEVIGRGGMGLVYRARQDNPRRDVAIKVLRPGLLTEKTQRRFEAEVEALSRLDHPGIARIYEAGTDDLGFGEQAYYVMELVEGQPFTVWAKGRALEERLAAFVALCRAVEHANRNGVVHRDLKPDNVLVTSSGDPKVLDFGVARVVDEEAGNTQFTTVDGEVMGTLPYMSPEQVGGDRAQLDARTDVYALGVLLYELLSGGLPHELGGLGLAEAARVIREEEARSLHDQGSALDRDLATIVAKALEKDHDRRYASADALAADVGRFLHHEPITARPPSTIYQLRRFASRHRGLVGGLAAAALVLIVAVIGLTILNVKATRAAVVAESKTAVAEGVNDYLLKIIGSGSNWEDGREAKIADVLARASDELDAAFPDHPEVEAAVHQMLGVVYMEMPYRTELRGRAKEHLERALELQEMLGPRIEDVLRLKHNLGRALGNDHEATVAHYEPLLEEIERELGSEHELLFAAALRYTRALFYTDREPEAFTYLNGMDGTARRVLGEDARTYLQIRSALFAFAAECGDYETAVRISEENMELKLRVLGEEHFNVLFDRMNLARLLRLLGRFAEAEEHILAIRTPWSERLGADDDAMFDITCDLVRLYGDMGRLSEGHELSTELVHRIDAKREQIPDYQPAHGRSWIMHGWMLLEAGRLDEAEAFCRRALDAGVDAGDAQGIRARYVLARVQIERGELEQGERELDELRTAAADALLPGEPLRALLGLEPKSAPVPD